MDVTPQLIEQIDFSEKFRGYDPDQVDEFLERVGATIVELNNRLASAEARAEEAAASVAAASAVQASDQAAAAAPPAPAMSDEEEAAAATSTLMLAKRTADAAIADARTEATKHLTDAHERAERELADAQAESARLIADATARSDELAARAVAEAEAEHGRRRDLIMVEITELESRRAGLLDGVTALERRSSDHRASLEHMISMLRDVLDDPDALVEPDAGPSGTTPVVEATASEVSAVDGSADSDAAAPDDGEPAAPPDAPLVEEPVAAAAAAVDQQGSHVDEPTMAHPYVAVDDAAAPDATVDEGDLIDDAVSGETSEPAETWGPGSWSEVAAVVDAPAPATPESEPEPRAEQPLQQSAAPAAPSAPPVAPAPEATAPEPQQPTTSQPVFARPPSIFDSVPADPPPSAAPEAAAPSAPPAAPLEDSGASPTRDRYLKDLDDAVNAEDGSGDEAMAAFFEGDEKPAPRRFGRRR